MRQLEGIWQRAVSLIGILLCVFHLYTGVFGLLPAPQQRAVHVALALTLVFFLFPARKAGGPKGSVSWYDLLCIMLVLGAASYAFFNYQRYIPAMITPPNPIETALAVAAILVILESGRRTIGWVFPSLTAAGLAYAFWGHYIPGEFGHAPFSLMMSLKFIFFSIDGVWGFLTGLSATYIALFVIFGSILLVGGGGKTFIDLALLIAGRFRGGSAKVAVFASSFFAMLSGSPMANVATTGNFTIPMMKKLGYSPEFAGGVESVASTGGVLTPPIMGAAGFIMAELLNIPYLKVCVAAAIPAFLFYLAVFMGVHFQAVKLNLRPIPREELPTLRSVLTYSRMSCLLLPIGVLLYTLIEGYSLTLVGSSTCLTALVTHIFSDLSLHGIKGRLRNTLSILEAGGKALTSIVPILICANIVLCLLSFTGLSIKFSAAIMSVGESNVFMSLFMAGILVMILGCGLPTTAAYILGVTVAAPMLAAWGILPLAAHLFILFYSLLATITPPVCPTVFVARVIAQSDWLKTAWVALKLAPLLYILPFLFVFNPTFILIGSATDITLNVGTATIGAIVLVSGTMGQLVTKANIFESLLLVAAGLLLLIPGWQTDLAGGLLVAVILVKQLIFRRRQSESRS